MCSITQDLFIRCMVGFIHSALNIVCVFPEPLHRSCPLDTEGCVPMTRVTCHNYYIITIIVDNHRIFFLHNLMIISMLHFLYFETLSKLEQIVFIMFWRSNNRNTIKSLITITWVKMNPLKSSYIHRGLKQLRLTKVLSNAAVKSKQSSYACAPRMHQKHN